MRRAKLRTTIAIIVVVIVIFIRWRGLFLIVRTFARGTVEPQRRQQSSFLDQVALVLARACGVASFHSANQLRSHTCARVGDGTAVPLQVAHRVRIWMIVVVM